MKLSRMNITACCDNMAQAIQERPFILMQGEKTTKLAIWAVRKKSVKQASYWVNFCPFCGQKVQEEGTGEDKFMHGLKLQHI